MSRKLRWGVIGTGMRGRTHLHVLGQATSRAEVVALCDVTPAALDEASALAPGARHYTDYRELLRDAGVEAVALVTPNYLHEEQAVATLESGRHLLCEKPLATTTAGADAILAAATRSRGQLLVGHELRFAPVYQELARQLAAARIGRLVQMVHTELRWDWSPRGWKVWDPARGEPVNWRHLEWATGGTLLEKSCHFTDLFAMATGAPPERIHLAGGIGHWLDGRTNPDHLAATFEYAGGVLATHVLAMNFDPMHDEFRLLGTEGELIVRQHQTLDVRRYGETATRLVDATGAQADTPGVPRHTGDCEMHAAFAAAVLDGAPLPFANEIARDAVKTGELALRSWRSRRVMNWEAD